VGATATSEALAERVRSWIAEDPDPACQAELRSLLEQERFAELAERFGQELSFGTAGLRGRLGAGPARMNRVTVRRATAGLAEYLKRANVAGASVVLGHDARHGSAAFADEAARTLTGAGIRALRLSGEIPTPVLAFAVRELGCAAGIMITASHNPPQDNGYKVYLGDGAQIAPPVDAQITQCTRRVGAPSEVPLGSAGEAVPDTIITAYCEATVAAIPAVEPEPLRIVYTPVHGVGRDLLLAAFARADFPQPDLVESQADPDPDFPTLERPNPEEPGALDLALSEAQRRGADLLLANDPDADRLAVAIPSDQAGTAWRVLTGDEVGALLARHLLAHCRQVDRALVITTVASATLLERMARDAGAEFLQTLTGFKWMMRAVAEAHERKLLFAYEEALGYAVSDVVRDKDGISAALLMSQVAMQARREGTTVQAYLDELALRFGLHATRQVSIEGRDPERIMHNLREHPPHHLAGRAVTAVEDLLSGQRLPRSDVLVVDSGDDTRVVIRPSGTEPKLKAYLQVVLDASHAPLSAVRRRATRRLDALSEEVDEWMRG
jgi:phosphomannomutase